MKESGERGFCNNNKRKKKARERMKLEEKYITFEVVVVVADHRFQSTYFSRLTRRQLLLAVAESTSLN